jgi:hypothetical protein
MDKAHRWFSAAAITASIFTVLHITWMVLGLNALQSGPDWARVFIVYISHVAASLLVCLVLVGASMNVRRGSIYVF